MRKSGSNKLTPLQHMIEEREAQAAADKKATELADLQLKQAKKKDAIPESPKFGKAQRIARQNSLTLMPPPKTPLDYRGGGEGSKKQNVNAEKDLEDWLKRYCLTRFDNATARSIMYKPEKSKFAPSRALKIP